jgi:L-ascorbate oxidase
MTRFTMTGGNGGLVQDNFPLGVAVRCTIRQWRDGLCQSKAEVMDIPFTQLGEFVYHCHILEHEDGGMMARIQVVPSPN